MCTLSTWNVASKTFENVVKFKSKLPHVTIGYRIA